MDFRAFIDQRGGIVHRSSVLAARVSARALQRAVARGEVERVRRYWIATPSAPTDLRTAALSTARVACVSAARRRGWWMPPAVDAKLHLHVLPHAERPRGDHVAHWTRPLVPVGRALVESVYDTLDHISTCADAETATVLWESASRVEGVTPADLRRVRWRSRIALRFQQFVAGHPADALIGDRLIVQLDGFAFHSSSADRTRDVAHDRELVARGYTVLRFTYAEVLHRWDVVERAVRRALAQGAHLAS